VSGCPHLRRSHRLRVGLNPLRFLCWPWYKRHHHHSTPLNLAGNHHEPPPSSFIDVKFNINVFSIFSSTLFSVTPTYNSHHDRLCKHHPPLRFLSTKSVFTISKYELSWLFVILVLSICDEEISWLFSVSGDESLCSPSSQLQLVTCEGYICVTSED
jgi:hypothetical protein